MITQEIPSKADFRGRTKANDVPIARLIGFEAKDIADGAGDGRLGSRTTACKSHGNAAWRCSLRHC
jgi:hypothetical protein